MSDPPPPPTISPPQGDEQAVSSSRQPTPSNPSIDHPVQVTSNTNTTAVRSPPTPSFTGLSLVERNALKRKYEKAMYEYMTYHGTVSTTEICGPCERTNARCVRLASMKKCALCFRGHDVCEMWDESVANIGRRRANTKSQKKDHKKDKVLYLGGGSTLIVDG